jgi:toxin ParE1/3/4
MSQCLITRRASRDLDEISEYFVGRNIEAGEKLLKLFNEKCMKLIQFPNMGKSYDVCFKRTFPSSGYVRKINFG